ncbi:MAG: saccharopine dehydrogenase NADP-binding domain-containing protein [Verrucomicrobiota bacterium]
MAKTIFILGGAGGAGLPCARWLLRETDSHLTIGGRDVDRAVTTAQRLNEEFSGGRVSAVRVDAGCADTLATALEGPDFLLVCSPTAGLADRVASAALAAGIDYMDIHCSPKVVTALRGLEPAIRRDGRCFITQGGCHPGLPAALVRYGVRHFSRLRKAMVGMAMNVANIGTIESVAEFAEDMAHYSASVFRNGRWEKAGWRAARKIDFGPDFGTKTCAPMDLEELRDLPAQMKLEELGLYAAGFTPFVDYVVFPLLMGVTGLLDGVRKGWGARTSARLLRWGIHRFSQPPFGIVFKMEAEGEKNGRSRLLTLVARHVDAYEFTAIPVVACLRQYLDGSIARPGLWLMGQAVDPVRLLKDMEHMGVRFDITETF